jgi:mono/diheme cytochrome c family protein
MRRKAFFLFSFILLTGCRGFRSEETPFHLNPNFDWQSKFKAQSLSSPVPEGVVAWGNDESFSDPKTRERYEKANSAFYRGKSESGQFVSRVPIEVNEAVIKRGQERYNIYCSMCHDQAGSGKGIVVQRGFTPPPNLGDPRLIAESDGYLFNVITEGLRNMPSYAKQISEEDRWAIVVYVRALQRVQRTVGVAVPKPATPTESAADKETK